MKRIPYIIILFILPLYLLAQSTNQNYILKRTYQTADQTGFLDQIQYYDGLGRPSETVQKAITPSGKDLVSLTEYDDLGREYKHWLPAPATGNTGAFVNATDFAALASTQYGNSEQPYSLTELEASPQNRVTGQYGAGSAWYSAGKKISTDYLANTANNVEYYYIENNVLKHNAEYPANSLFVTKVSDENGKYTYEFKDKLGRVIMKQGWDTSYSISTYYVYNDLGQLCYVLPEMAVEGLGTNTTTGYNTNNTYLTQYAYLYQYDERGNNVVKRLPGCDSICMVYDKANRLVASQDGNQRLKNNWTITKYDALGRVVYTGLMNQSTSRNALASEIKDLVITEQYDSINSTFYNTGYTCNYFKNEVTPITVNYYDNYNFIKKNSMNLAFSTQVTGYTAYYSNSKGLLTGTRIYMLDENINSYPGIATAMYYDDKGRVVQTRATNYLGGYDNLYTAYDFTGKVLNTYKEHSIPGFSNYPEQCSYTYDQAGRLLDTNHQYGILAPVKLSSNKYDELGRLVTTYRHNATDSVKYEYNIRNWTTKLKSGPSFEEDLYYNTNPLSTSLCYNGNISYSNWTYNGVSKGYAYTYDDLNRLKNANFKQGTSSQTDGSFDESFTYDKLGNIQTLQRKKDNSQIDNLSLHYNGNQLTYVDDGAGSQNLSTVKEYQNKSTATSNEFAYDKNGNMNIDLDRNIVTIRYNLLNLPDTIQFKNGNEIINRYDAAGRKLQSDYYTSLLTLTPIAEGQVLNPENGYSDAAYSYSGTAYISNMEYSISKNKSPGEGGVGWVYIDVFTPQRMYNAEGYVDNISASISTFMTNGVLYNYFRRDHLGNNREVWNGIRKNYSGTVKGQAATRQRTQYYPSGLPWASNTNDYPSVQSHKYNDKEFIEMDGLDTYDYNHRGYYPAGGFFTTADPLCEMKPWQSPYIYCSGNPVNRTDPTGLDDMPEVYESEVTVTAPDLSNNNSNSSPSVELDDNANRKTPQISSLILPMSSLNLPTNSTNQQSSGNKTVPQNKQLAEVLAKINKILTANGLVGGVVSVVVKNISGVSEVAVIFKGGGALAALNSIGKDLSSTKVGMVGIALTLIADVGNNLVGNGSLTKTAIDFGVGIIGLAIPEVGLVYLVLDHYGVIDGGIDLVSGAINRQPINVPDINKNIVPQDHTNIVIPNYSH